MPICYNRVVQLTQVQTYIHTCKESMLSPWLGMSTLALSSEE